MTREGEQVRGDRGMFFGAIVALTMVLLPGCSAGKETAVPKHEQLVGATTVDTMTRQLATQHFLDGCIFDMKGDYARAVLEYQDALRMVKDHAVYFALSKDYSLLNKASLAIEAAKEALRLRPDKLEYRRNLADIYAGAFEIDAAAEQYEAIVKQDSDNIEARYNLARLLQMHKPLKALEVYRGIIDRFGPEWDVLLPIAELSNKLGQFDSAASALREMTIIDPGNQELRRSLAQTYVRAGKLDSALSVYSQLREMKPENLEYIAEIAGVHLLKKEYDKAALLFQSILSRDTVSLEVKLRIGELYFGQLEKDSTLAPLARKIYEGIRDKHPSDWHAYWFLGAIGSITHDDSLTVQNFRKVTELASWNADAWVYLSNVFLVNNNYTEVARILESAVKVVPDEFRVNFLLGFSYSRLGRNIEAVKLLEHAHQLKPKDEDAISQLALVYDGLKQFDESDRLYEEALKLNPKNDLVLNNYAYSLAERGVQLERALGMAEKAVSANGENSSYLDTMGWVYFRLGRYKDAEVYVRKALSKGETNAVVYEHLGDIYSKLNDRERALEQWNNALKLDENNTALRDKIARGTL